MGQARSRLTDKQVEKTVGILLRSGVIGAAMIVLIGGILYLVRHGTAVPDYQVFRGEPADLRTVPGIVKDALSLRTRGVIQPGLLLLIATPVARVIFPFLSLQCSVIERMSLSHSLCSQYLSTASRVEACSVP